MTIAATIGIDEAVQFIWDAIVVGAGPAGAMAARDLAKRGRRVLLVDKSSFPRRKICGCCLSGLALSALSSAGLGKLPEQEGAIPLKSLLLGAGSRSALVPLLGGVALSRDRFDAALIESAIAAGAHFLPETTVGDRSLEKDCLAVTVNQRSQLRARIVIAADGLNGRLLPTATEPLARSRIGAGAIAAVAPDFFSCGTIYMACGPTGYVGMVRLEDDRLDIAAALDPDAVRTHGLAGAVAAILAQTRWPTIEGLYDLAWRGTPALTRQPRQSADHRLFVVGDAAGYVEPFTGEGMAWALTSALALTNIADRAIERWQPELLNEWTQLQRRLIGRRQAICRWMAWLLRSPLLCRSLVGILSFAPVLARPYLHHLHGSRSLRSNLAFWKSL